MHTGGSVSSLQVCTGATGVSESAQKKMVFFRLLGRRFYNSVYLDRVCVNIL